MRIYFNLNTVAGKVLGKKAPSCTALVLLEFFLENVGSGLSERDRYSASRLRSLLRFCRVWISVCLFGWLVLFYGFSDKKKKRSDADSDNSVTVKVVLKHFR